MKRLLIALLATFSALSAPIAFADTCEVMFRKKQIYYPQNKSKSLFAVFYSTEPNKINPAIEDFSNWKECKNTLIQKISDGKVIYCDNKLLLQFDDFSRKGNWFDKNGGKWPFYSIFYPYISNTVTSCTKISSTSYYDRVRDVKMTNMDNLQEYWVFIITETRYFEKVNKPEF